MGAATQVSDITGMELNSNLTAFANQDVNMMTEMLGGSLQMLYVNYTSKKPT